MFFFDCGRKMHVLWIIEEARVGRMPHDRICDACRIPRNPDHANPMLKELGGKLFRQFALHPKNKLLWIFLVDDLIESGCIRSKQPPG